MWDELDREEVSVQLGVSQQSRSEPGLPLVSESGRRATTDAGHYPCSGRRDVDLIVRKVVSCQHTHSLADSLNISRLYIKEIIIIVARQAHQIQASGPV